MANQFRNYLITINNPTWSDTEFDGYLKSLEHIKYFIFQREKGKDTGTEHFQLYIEFNFGKKFEVIKKLFPTAHIESRKGTKKQAREYCCKEDTRIEGGQVYEHGTFAEERERTDISDIIQLVKDGATDSELLELYPSQAFMYQSKIQAVRQSHFAEKYRNVFRKLEVIYIYGSAGVGKTRHVMEGHGYSNVFRVTNYDHEQSLFDAYRGENVVLFEEFRSSLKIEKMLNYLDGYPLMLPSRYNDKVAQYTKVYLVTNIPLCDQYKNAQQKHVTTWQAFLRRITAVYNFDISKTNPIPKDFIPLVPLSDEKIDELGF